MYVYVYFLLPSYVTFKNKWLWKANMRFVSVEMQDWGKKKKSLQSMSFLEAFCSVVLDIGIFP